MDILLVEDDHFQAELITEKIRERFPSAGVRRVKTESDFRSMLDQLAVKPPSLVIMDVMLRWADPTPDMPEAPEEVRRGSFYRAGLRCQELLASRQETKQIPVILYTVLESVDLKAELSKITNVRPLTYLRKQSDLSPLVEEISRIAKKKSSE